MGSVCPFIRSPWRKGSSVRTQPLLCCSACRSDPARKQPFPYPLQQADCYFNWHDLPLLNVVLNEFSILGARPFPLIPEKVTGRKVCVSIFLQQARQTGSLQTQHLCKPNISQHWQPYLSLHCNRKTQGTASGW